MTRAHSSQVGTPSSGLQGSRGACSHMSDAMQEQKSRPAQERHATQVCQRMQGDSAWEPALGRNTIATCFDVILAQKVGERRTIKVRNASALDIEGELFTVVMNSNQVCPAKATLWKENFLFVLDVEASLAQKLSPNPFEGMVAMEARALSTRSNVSG